MEGSIHERGAVSGAILAGGTARRLGGLDKSALVVDGRRIIDRQLDALAAVTDQVVVIGGAAASHRGLTVTVVPDREPGTGPLGGLHTALVTAATPLVIVLACDLPFVDARLLDLLVASIGDADACVPRDARRWHPLCACYATRCAPALGANVAAGRLKVIDAVQRLRCVEIGPDVLTRLDPSGRLLTNVNTPDDLAALGDAR